MKTFYIKTFYVKTLKLYIKTFYVKTLLISIKTYLTLLLSRPLSFLLIAPSPPSSSSDKVWSVQQHRPIRPIRDPHMRNAVPKKCYPMNEYPPFAYGGHWLMSRDGAEFIARNRHELRGVGTS